MDKLVGMGKDMLQQQMAGEGSGRQQDKSGGGGIPSEVLTMAQQHAAGSAGGSGSSDLFSNIMSAVGQRQDRIRSEDVDEQDAVKQHQNAYENDGKADGSSLGTAAAMQALKKFTQSDNSASSSAGQAAFLGMAMSEASKLFDDKSSQGKVEGSASKDKVVQQAAETAMKMYFKSQASSQGGLAGMAAKFLG